MYEGVIIYVGSTSRGLNKRFYQLISGHSNGTKLSNWIKTQDRTKFSMIPLEICVGENRYTRENFWIKHHDTINNGFNTEEAREENTPKKKFPGRPTGAGNPKGSDHYLYGKKLSRHIVEASVAARIGKPLSEEHKAKQRAAHAEKGHTYKHTKTVVCDQTGETWPTIADAADHYKIPRSTLHLWIQKKRPHLGLTFSAIPKT